MAARSHMRFLHLHDERVAFEFRKVTRNEAVRMFAAVMAARPMGWGTMTAQAHVAGKWQWVGPRTARDLGVFHRRSEEEGGNA